MMDANFTEKRRFPRIDERIPVRFRDLRKTGEVFKGTISRDISEGGVRFKSDRFISLACRLIVEFGLPTTPKPVRAVSKITWIQKLPTGDDYEVGNQFLEISREDKENIRNFVKEKLEAPSF